MHNKKTLPGFAGLILSSRLAPRQAAPCAALLLAFFAPSAFAVWQQTDTSVAWKSGDKVVWKFNFDPAKGKPFFDPLTVAAGPDFTNSQPADHSWHYGLWFSWKYINHVNYWEEDTPAGKAEGSTTWLSPTLTTRPDGSAKIVLSLTYTNPQKIVEMTESRMLEISAPAQDGSYSIEWSSHFTVGKEPVTLDRTPMPGEPNGAVNGGYAGLGLRMAGAPLVVSVTTPAGPVTKFDNLRARPNSPSVAFNFTDGPKDLGGIAILSDPLNAGENPPWYIVNDLNTENNGQGFRFACAAILAPKPLTLPANGTMNFHYRISLNPKAWTPEALKTAQQQLVKPAP